MNRYEISEDNIIDFYNDILDAVEEIAAEYRDEWIPDEPLFIDEPYYKVIEKFDEIMNRWGVYEN